MKQIIASRVGQQGYNNTEILMLGILLVARASNAELQEWTQTVLLEQQELGAGAYLSDASEADGVAA
eukprot:1775359-Pleurochrysis_carterae.AAC.3